MKNQNEENHYYECNDSLNNIKECPINTIQINLDNPEENNFLDKKKNNSSKQEFLIRDYKNPDSEMTENVDNEKSKGEDNEVYLLKEERNKNFQEEENFSEIDKHLVLEDINKFKTINNNYIYSSIDSNSHKNFEIYSQIRNYSNINEKKVYINYLQENEYYGLEKFSKSEEYYEHSISHKCLQSNDLNENIDNEISHDNIEHKKEQLIINNLNKEYNHNDINYNQYKNQQEFTTNSKIQRTGYINEMTNNQNIIDNNNRYMIEYEDQINNITDNQKNLYKENFRNKLFDCNKLKDKTKISKEQNNQIYLNAKEQNFNIEDKTNFGEKSIKTNNHEKKISNLDDQVHIEINKYGLSYEEKVLDNNNENKMTKNQLLNEDGKNHKNDYQKFPNISQYHKYKTDENSGANSSKSLQKQNKFKIFDYIYKEDIQNNYNKDINRDEKINSSNFKKNMKENHEQDLNHNINTINDQNFCEILKKNDIENQHVNNNCRESEEDDNSLLRSLEEKWESIERSRKEKLLRYNYKNNEYLSNNVIINQANKVFNIYNDDKFDINLNKDKFQLKNDNFNSNFKNAKNFETLEHSQDFQNELSLRERKNQKHDAKIFLDKSEVCENVINFNNNKGEEKLYNNSNENWFTIDKNIICIKNQNYYEENDINLNDENSVLNNLHILAKNPSSKINNKFIDKCDQNKKQTFQSFNNFKNSSALDFYNNLSLSKNFIYDSGKKSMDKDNLEESEDEDELDFFIKEKTYLLKKIKEKNSRKINRETNIENIEEEITKENEGLHTYSNKEKDLIIGKNNEKIFDKLKFNTRNLIEKIYNENSINSKTIEDSLNEINNNIYDILKKESVFSINSTLEKQKKIILNQDTYSGVYIYEPNLSKNKFSKKYSSSENNECNFKPSFLNPLESKGEKFEREEKKLYYLNYLNNNINRLNQNFNHNINFKYLIKDCNDNNLENYENYEDKILYKIVNTNNSHSTTNYDNNNNTHNLFNTFGMGVPAENKIIDEVITNNTNNKKVKLNSSWGLQIKKNHNSETIFDSCKEAINYINYNTKNGDIETDVYNKNLKNFENYNLNNSSNNNINKNEIQITNQSTEVVNYELMNNFTPNSQLKEKIKNLYDDLVKMNSEIENKNSELNQNHFTQHTNKYSETITEKPRYVNKNIKNINNNNNFYCVSNSNDNIQNFNFSNLIFSNNKSFPNVSLNCNSSHLNKIITSSSIENNFDLMKKNLVGKEKSILVSKNKKEHSLQKNSHNSLNIPNYSISNKNYIRSFNSYYGDYLNNVNQNNSNNHNDKNIHFPKNLENISIRKSNFKSPQITRNPNIINKINENIGLIGTFSDIKRINNKYSDEFGHSTSCLKNLNSNLNLSDVHINKNKLYNTQNNIFQPNLLDSVPKSNSKYSNIIKESFNKIQKGTINDYKNGLIMSNLNNLTSFNYKSPSEKIKNKK